VSIHQAIAAVLIDDREIIDTVTVEIGYREGLQVLR